MSKQKGKRKNSFARRSLETKLLFTSVPFPHKSTPALAKRTLPDTEELGSAQKNSAWHGRTLLGTEELCPAQKNPAQKNSTRQRRTRLGTKELRPARKNSARHRRTLPGTEELGSMKLGSTRVSYSLGSSSRSGWQVFLPPPARRP